MNMSARTYKNKVSLIYRYSMVEILVVLAIIAILMGMGIGGYSVVRRKMATARTEATLNKIRVALESYKSKYGYYPQTNGTAAPFCLDLNDPVNEKYKMQNNFNQFIDYGKISSEESTVISSCTIDGILVNRYAVGDGWETKIWNTSTNTEQVSNFIIYVCPGLVNQDSYDLFSAGLDRNFRWSATSDADKSENTDNIWPQGLKRK